MAKKKVTQKAESTVFDYTKKVIEVKFKDFPVAITVRNDTNEFQSVNLFNSYKSRTMSNFGNNPGIDVFSQIPNINLVQILANTESHDLKAGRTVIVADKKSTIDNIRVSRLAKDVYGYCVCTAMLLNRVSGMDYIGYNDDDYVIDGLVGITIDNIPPKSSFKVQLYPLLDEVKLEKVGSKSGVVAILLENNSNKIVKNIVLMKSFNNRTASNHGMPENVKAISIVPHIDYIEILAATESMMFKTREIHITTENKKQLLLRKKAIVYNFNDEGACSPVNLKFDKIVTTKLPGRGKYVPISHKISSCTEFLIDGFTSIVIPELLPKTKIKIELSLIERPTQTVYIGQEKIVRFSK